MYGNSIRLSPMVYIRLTSVHTSAFYDHYIGRVKINEKKLMTNVTGNNYSNVWPAELEHDMRMPQVDNTLKIKGRIQSSKTIHSLRVPPGTTLKPLPLLSSAFLATDKLTQKVSDSI